MKFLLKIRKILTKNQKGFTLVELIVVIAILGILAAIAVPRIIGTLDNASQRADETNAHVIETASQLYYAEEGSYPTDVALLVTDGYLDEDPLATLQFYTSYTYNSGDGSVTLTP